MEWFLTQEGLNVISCALVGAVAMWCAISCFNAYLERSDAQWIVDNPPEPEPERPKLYAVDPTNLDQLLALHGANEQDRDDIIKGTQL